MAFIVLTARPVALAFETDRLVTVTANGVQTDTLAKAPPGLQHLPWAGVLQVNTGKPVSGAEMMATAELGLGGISPGMRPDWWLPWSAAQDGMRQRAKPLAELIARRPQAAQPLQDAARDAGHAVAALSYLPLVSSKTLDWVALLDEQMNMVGWAPVDGF